jgi:2-dehydro-3-deoxyphosphogluconate aldolase/(4S)-4-hydroxy-2-oxoglutarate aldolase
MMLALSTLLKGSPLLPIIQTDQPAQAVAIAKAMAAGGVTAVEVVLRTEQALKAITAIRQACPELLVGAGTVLNAQQAQSCVWAGAQFLVSPCATEKLLAGMLSTGLPVAPGVSTVTEMAAVHEFGLNELKFFPAHLSGGVGMLQAVRSILPKVRFCPTGGIGLHNLGEFLKQPNVFVAGGSWLTTADVLKSADYAAITALTAQSLEIAATVLADKAGLAVAGGSVAGAEPQLQPSIKKTA